jgi:hypothetical protein
MSELEVRGFLTTGCNDCQFAQEKTGGYDNDTILGYWCLLSQREIGKGHNIPESFPDNCRLKRIEDKNATVYQKYKRIVEQIKIANEIIED